MQTDHKKLRLWQERLSRNEAAYAAELSRMDDREALYAGDRRLRAVTERDGRKTRAPHVRNLCAELIEAQVDSAIPQPRVTARRKGDEDKAKLIEDMLRNELDRLPMEQLNDVLSRTVPIQGGAALLVEWDNFRCTHLTRGELAVSALHPRQLIPQDGVTTGLEDMDYFILKLPQTRESIRRRYGVTVEPSAGPEGEEAGEETVTEYAAYYRNDRGGIGLYRWAGDTQLEDREDYQARQQTVCAGCGAPLPDPGPEEEPAPCPLCGGLRRRKEARDCEEPLLPPRRSDGSLILPAPGEKLKIPVYRPGCYPVVLLRNVSVYGKLLGDSDLDKIADQQNTTNRIESKIIDKLLKSGSYITLPDDASIRADAEDMKVIRPGSPADKAMIDVYDLQGNISADMAYLAQVYEEARQAIGITDSFQGRRDSTAVSGRAKEFSAAQAAGRLESKQVMKNAAWAALFEAMFKFKLAYTDEPRPVVADDLHGNPTYREFSRWDFLEQDAAGAWYWNDQFLFSCDDASPLAANREAMWQETRLNLQSGAFGDPASLETLILFWSKMERLHYPGAGETRRYLEETATGGGKWKMEN